MFFVKNLSAVNLSALFFICLFPIGAVYASKPFIGSDKESRFSQKEYPLKKKDFNKENRFSGSRFQFKEWDKHYSKLGQKKVFSEKSQNQFNNKIEKELSNFEMLEYRESNWNDYFSKIRKEANIEVDQNAQILSDRVTYTLLLQDTQQFEEMAEKMDLRSINRFQFRSNRPEGEIPVDSVDGTNGN